VAATMHGRKGWHERLRVSSVLGREDSQPPRFHAQFDFGHPRLHGITLCNAVVARHHGPCHFNQGDRADGYHLCVTAVARPKAQRAAHPGAWPTRRWQRPGVELGDGPALVAAVGPAGGDLDRSDAASPANIGPEGEERE